MNNIPTLIVDDEYNSRSILKDFLLKYCNGINIVAEAASVVEAEAAIKLHQPKLVFLDINMPLENGFGLFKRIPEPDFYTVFVTAHDEYAQQAIKHHAFDYILKPINLNELIETVYKVQRKIDTAFSTEQLTALLRTIQQPSAIEKIALPVLDGFIYVPIEEIIRFEAEGNYTHVHFINRSKILVSRTLGSYEELLKDQNFVRVHHHHLINLHHVEKYQRGRGGVVFMSDKKEIEVSQRKREIFLKQINGVSNI